MKNTKSTILATITILGAIYFLIYVIGLFHEAIENIPTEFAIGFRANG